MGTPRRHHSLSQDELLTRSLLSQPQALQSSAFCASTRSVLVLTCSFEWGWRDTATLFFEHVDLHLVLKASYFFLPLGCSLSPVVINESFKRWRGNRFRNPRYRWAGHCKMGRSSSRMIRTSERKIFHGIISVNVTTSSVHMLWLSFLPRLIATLGYDSSPGWLECSKWNTSSMTPQWQAFLC